MASMKKRLLSGLLAAVMALTLLPAQAMAWGWGEEGGVILPIGDDMELPQLYTGGKTAVYASHEALSVSLPTIEVNAGDNLSSSYYNTARIQAVDADGHAVARTASLSVSGWNGGTVYSGSTLFFLDALPAGGVYDLQLICGTADDVRTFDLDYELQVVDGNVVTYGYIDRLEAFEGSPDPAAELTLRVSGYTGDSDYRFTLVSMEDESEIACAASLASVAEYSGQDVTELTYLLTPSSALSETDTYFLSITKPGVLYTNARNITTTYENFVPQLGILDVQADEAKANGLKVRVGGLAAGKTYTVLVIANGATVCNTEVTASKDGVNTFTVSLSKNGVEAPLTAYGDTLRVDVSGTDHYASDSMMYYPLGGSYANQSATLTLTQTAAGASFELTAVNLLEDLYEAAAMPSFTVSYYDEAAGQSVQVGTAVTTERTTETRWSSEAYVFIGTLTLTEPLERGRIYSFTRTDSGGAVASGRLRETSGGGGTAGGLAIGTTRVMPVSGNEFYFVFGEMPVSVYLTNAGETATASLYDLTANTTVSTSPAVAATNDEYGGRYFTFRIPQPADGVSADHKYDIRFTSAGETVSLCESLTRYEDGLIFDGTVGRAYFSVMEPVFAGETELTLRTYMSNCKNLPANYLESNPVVLVQSGSEIGVTVTSVTADADGSYYDIRVKCQTPLAAGTYTCTYTGSSSQTFRVLPEDAVYLGGYDSGTGLITDCRNLPAGTYTGTLYAVDTWRNGGQPLGSVSLVRESGETLRVTGGLTGLNGSGYLEIDADGAYVGTISVYQSSSRDAIPVQGYEIVNDRFSEITYLTKASTIYLQTVKPGYAYVRYALGSGVSGAAYQPIQAYYNQPVDLGADGDKVVSVQFRKASGEESEVYAWRCRKDSTLADPALTSVTVLVDGKETHTVPKNTAFTLRAVVNTQYADVNVCFAEPGDDTGSYDHRLAYKGAAPGGGYLFEQELNSSAWPFYSLTCDRAIFELLDFAGRTVLEEKEYALTFEHDEVKTGITLDDWRYATYVYTNQTSYTVTGTAAPNSKVTVTWGQDADTVTATATADGTGRFSAVLTGLKELGNWSSKLQASDSTGNATSDKYLVVDRTPPVIEALNASVAPESDKNAAITWRVTDENTDYCILWRDGVLIDGNYRKTESGSYNYIALWAEGTEYAVQAVDKAGNTSEKKTITVKGDTVAPEMTVNPVTARPIGGTTYLTVTGTAADNLGLARAELQYSLDGGATYQAADSEKLTGTSANWTVTFRGAAELASGEVLVKAVVYDASGNTAEASVGTFPLDNTPPAVPENLFAAGGDGGIDLEWTHAMAEDDFNHFNIYRADSAEGEGKLVKPVDVTRTTDTSGLVTGGTYYYYVTAVDSLGNESDPTPVQSAVNTADLEKPVIVNVTPASPIIVTGDGTVTIQVEATDNNKLGKCEITGKGGAVLASQEPAVPTKSTAYAFTLTKTDPDDITITVYDARGNSASVTMTCKPYEAPVAPSGLTASAEADSPVVRLTWTYGGDVDMLSMFAVYRAPQGGEFAYIDSVPATAAAGYVYEDQVRPSGTYVYRVTAVDRTVAGGSQSAEASAAVQFSDTEPPVAVINPSNLTCLEGGTLTVSAAASTDDSGLIYSYEWDFGDGSAPATGVDAAHVYAQKGTYTVTLTVTDAAGNQSTATATASVLEPAALAAGYTQVSFYVCDAKDASKAVSNAQITLAGTDTSYMDVLTTGADGRATVVLPDGSYQITVAHRDYAPRSFGRDLDGGTLELPPIGLGSALSGELNVTEMTDLDEIRAAGIDTDNPDNRHVYRFKNTIGFGAEAIVYEVYKNQAGIIVKKSPPIRYTTVNNDSCVIYPISEKFALVIYGEVHWLKEMFRVELLVFNDSQVDELNGVTAELTLPDGLSLAAMTTGEQTARQSLGNIPSGGQTAAVWYVRGDKEGEYNLSATVNAVSMPFGDTVTQTFETEEPVKVWAGSALHMTVKPDAIARKGEPYNVTFRLENVSDKPVLDFSFLLTQSEQFQITKYQTGSLSAVKVEQLTNETYPDGAYAVRVPELKPGESVEVDFTTIIQFNSILEGLKISKPGRYVDVYYLLRDVWVSTLAGSTTSIPWSVEVNTNVRWPKPVNWKTDGKYTTAYGDLFETPTEELLNRYMELTGETLSANLGVGGKAVLTLEDAAAQENCSIYIQSAAARAGGGAVETDVLSAAVSADGRELTIVGKGVGTETVEFGVVDATGAVVRSWTYAFTVTGPAVSSTEQVLAPSADGTYEIDGSAWSAALAQVQQAERGMLEANPYQTFDSVLTWKTDSADYRVVLTAAQIQTLLDTTAVTGVRIDGAGADLYFDRAALTALAQSGGSLTLSAVRTGSGSESAYVFGTGGAAAQVTLPYTPQAGEQAVSITCLDAAGQAIGTLTGVCDSAAQTLTFTTNGAASYRIGAPTNPTNPSNPTNPLYPPYYPIFPGSGIGVGTGSGIGTGTGSRPDTSGPATTTIANGQVTTPAGMDAEVGRDKSVTLPGGGDITRRDGVRITAPAGTYVQSDGTVIVPSNRTAAVTLSTGTVLTLPGGSVIGSGEIAVGAGGANVPLEGGGTVFVPENTILVLDNSALGFYIMAGGLPESSVWRNPFIDVPFSAWYYSAVQFVHQNGLMNGTSSTVFNGDSNLTRGMLTQILYNKENQPPVGGNVFTDVADGAWYHDAVVWATSAGIVSGYGGGQFGPDDNVTREQLATMLWRYAGSPAASAAALTFSDADQVSGYALEALRWAVSNGIISGMGDGTLAPQGLATRAQVAQMLKNYLEK